MITTNTIDLSADIIDVRHRRRHLLDPLTSSTLRAPCGLKRRA